MFAGDSLSNTFTIKSINLSNLPEQKKRVLNHESDKNLGGQKVAANKTQIFLNCLLGYVYIIDMEKLNCNYKRVSSKILMTKKRKTMSIDSTAYTSEGKSITRDKEITQRKVSLPDDF